MQRVPNQNENSIIFRRTNGHSHNGINSTLIDTTKYSIFDFATFTSNENSDQSRKLRQENNKILLKKFIVSSIEEIFLRPQGIEIPIASINASHIATGTITANELTAELILVNNVIKSNIYTPGSSGWIISSNGSAEFSNVIVRGTVVANTGNIGGFTIDSNSIYSGTKGTNNNFTTGNNITIANTFISSKQFLINDTGDARFAGKLEAPTGNIGGWTINSSNITSSTGNTILYNNGYIQATSGKFSGQIEATSGNVGGILITSNSIYANSSGSYNIFETYTSNVAIKATGEISSKYTYRNVFGGGNTNYYTDTLINESDAGTGNSTAALIVRGNASGSDLQARIQPSVVAIGEATTGGGGTSITGTSISMNGGVTIYTGNVTVNSSVLGNFLTLANSYTVRNSGNFPTTSGTTTARIVLVGANEEIRAPSSLRELKENIEDISDAISILNELRPRVFNWKINSDSELDPLTNEPWTDEAKELRKLDKSYGFIVEEVHESRPDLVSYSHYDPEPPYDRPGGRMDISSWKPSMWEEPDVLALCVKAIQELNSKIEDLESRLKAIEDV